MSRYVHGQWNAVCDRCGNIFKSGQLRKTWEGLMVCDMDFEEQHPQDFVRAKSDNQRIPWSRPWNIEYDSTSDVTFQGDSVTWQGDSDVIW